MAHLHLLDDNIEILSKSLDILQSEQDMTAFDTDSFSYRPKKDGIVIKSKDGNGQLVWQWAN